jgi:hypothetical protein
MTQNEIVIKQLSRGRALTPGAAWRTFGIARLAARVHELKRHGHPIRTSMLTLSSGARVAQYSMGRR